jgi:hypothetical protein
MHDRDSINRTRGMRQDRLCCEFPLPAVIDPGQILFGFRLLLVLVLLTDRRKQAGTPGQSGFSTAEHNLRRAAQAEVSRVVQQIRRAD